MGDLQRLTVRVLLALLVFSVIGDYFDDIFLGDKLHTPPELFTLIGGMITGLFIPEALRTIRNGKNKPPDIKS